MSAAERVREARETVEKAIGEYADEVEFGDEIRANPWAALDAFAAAVRAETLAEVREAVEGMRRWDMVDIDGIEWSIGHDLEGEYLYRSEVLATLTRLEAP